MSTRLSFLSPSFVLRCPIFVFFQKHIVVGVAGHFQAARCGHDVAVVLDELEQFRRSSLRICSSGRESTSAYSSRMGRDT